MLAALILLLAQEEHTITGTGRSDAGEKPALVLDGKTSLPDGAVLTVTLWRGAPGTGRQLGGSLLVEAKDGAFSAAFALFRERNLPGDYAFEAVFSPIHQQQEVRRKMGRRFREYRGSVAFTVGTKAELDAAVAARIKHLASRVDLVEEVAKEVERDFHACLKAPERAGWRDRIVAWRKRIDDGFEGLDRLDNLLIPMGDAMVSAAGRLHEHVEQYMEIAGRILAGGVKEKERSVTALIAYSNALSREIGRARIGMGVAPGSAEVRAALRRVKEALGAAVAATGDEAAARAFREAALGAQAVLPRSVYAKYAAACGRGLALVARAAKGEEVGELDVDDVRQALDDVADLAKAELPQ